MPRCHLLFYLLSSFLLLAGCVGQQPLSMKELAALAASESVVMHSWPAGQFTLIVLLPRTPADSVLRVYVEGDGGAWKNRYWLSADPTPAHGVALQLMMADPARDKAYLARPCQYLQTESCEKRYWSSHRFSPEVLESMDIALDQMKQEGGYNQLELVGYSGGGAVAALLAAHRSDISGLRTVAGNLDPFWLNTYHRVAQLSGSLNPADYADLLDSIPQLHFIGANDRIVPEGVYYSYVSHFKNNRCLKASIITNADHHHNWIEQWPLLLQQSLECSEN